MSRSKQKERVFSPTSPGRRFLVLPSFDQLTKREGRNKTVAPLKALRKGKKRSCGRNHHGRITSRHRGGGHKRLYRIVDFKRDKVGIEAKVASIEYDPNRSAFIALLHYKDGEKRYIIAPEGLKQGDMVSTKTSGPFRVGDCARLRDLPLGSTVHNVELRPGQGGRMVRSAGMSAQLAACSEGFVTLRLPSSEMRLVPDGCCATLGMVSNPQHSLRSDGKAGRRRWMGERPQTRGVAMNPVDHAHGGTEGKGKGNHPQGPPSNRGKLLKGVKTRSKKKSNALIVRKRKNKRRK